MAPSKDIDPCDLLRDVEERSIGVSLPVPVSKRLDRLVELTETEGVRVFRKDLVGALLLAATDDPKALAALLTKYRTATAGDAALSGEPVAEVLELARAKPGRRRRGG
jgi:hypothetical protein